MPTQGSRSFQLCSAAGLALALSFCLPSNGQSPSRFALDCSIPGSSTCYFDFGFAGFTYGRSEGSPPRGPNPHNGTTDVDDLYDLLGDLHDYYTTVLNRNGPNGLGGMGDGVNAAFNAYVGFAHVENQSFGEQACSLGAGGYAQEWNIGICTGSVEPELVGHEAMHNVFFRLVDNGDGTFTKLGDMDEAGAMAEGMSDFFGEAFERYIEGDNDWLIDFGGVIYRDMANPPNVDTLVDDPSPHPDRYLSADYFTGSEDNGGIHYNASILNKASYLAVEGGDFNGHQIDGIGFEKVEQVWFRAATEYFTPEVTFNQAYGHLLQAASDLLVEEDVHQIRLALQSTEMHLSRDGLMGDFNADGVVNAADYTVWRDSEGATGEGLAADADRNGTIASNDLLLWEASYGSTLPQLLETQAVPEPTSALLLVSGLLGFAGRRCSV